MYDPVSTYRLQFHKGFSFRDFESAMNYLHQLGVKTIYAAPIFESTPGSSHGYDCFNPNLINPEIGDINQLKDIRTELQLRNMGWIQDIVPNHMAFDPKNSWINAILEKGPYSKYAHHFDINWQSHVHNGKVMVPFLGQPLDEVIGNGQLTLEIQNKEIGFRVYETFYPSNHTAYKSVLEKDQDHPAMHGLRVWLSELDYNKHDYENAFNDIKHRLTHELAYEPFKGIVDHNISEINKDKDWLRSLCDQQFYVLCPYYDTDQHINFRRFFVVNNLICLNSHQDNVFHDVHNLVGRLLREDIIQGVRIDHIDGLFDPREYLDKVNALTNGEGYVTVEKILQEDELVPANWKTSGSTGYDFLAMVNNVLTSKEHEQALNEFYSGISTDPANFTEALHKKKRLILYKHMNGELENLVRTMINSHLVNEHELNEEARNNIKSVIAEFLVHCPVYRYYTGSWPLLGDEAEAVQNILNHIGTSRPDLSLATETLGGIFLGQPAGASEDYFHASKYFYQRCMQFSSPLMAKGLEDTLMYTYNRFIAHNEVGDSPGFYGLTVKQFHLKMMERQKAFPNALNATATHDTKRGEDARARLNVLSAIIPEWLEVFKEWQRLNQDLKKDNAPDTNDEYFVYQTLLAHHPMPGEDQDNLPARLQQYLEKALREAKYHSTWGEPNLDYENAVKEFAVRLLDQDRPFWQSFQKFHTKVSDHGIINSLVQVLLKFTCPGVPDVYQGAELWDLSFVDPDNRRPVDYSLRDNYLQEIQAESDRIALLPQLWKERYNGKIKLWLTSELLSLRQRYPDVLTEGEHIHLAVVGRHRDNVIAFARKHRQSVIIVVAPLYLPGLANDANWKDFDWDDTAIELPHSLASTGTRTFSGEKITFDELMHINDLFKDTPFAVIETRIKKNVRGAGVLMHISSLPSSFGIGDFGPEARRFADFLYNSYQKYWQILPLTPIEGGQGYSPYSSTSSRAGNILLLSPEMFIAESLLTWEQVEAVEIPAGPSAKYHQAEELKYPLFEKAWQNFQSMAGRSRRKQFQGFCEKEKEWLDDFVLFTLLKQQHGGRQWSEWKDEFKVYNEETLSKFSDDHKNGLEKLRWLQFMFFKQWRDLKRYCNDREIEIIGDMPFYVSYDSADVWAHQDLFKLDEEGRKITVAGVPPDAFSEDGQLWGMPIFNWEKHEATGYKWWMQRLQKNYELYDITRLDHFRAFSAYWEVAADETTAKIGKWIDGPDAAFFEVIKTSMPDMPFIAEDLGDIDEPVNELRDAFALPGMKVLHFAFGDNLGLSVHLPHNYARNFFVYSGTHDNNTTKGWWREIGQDERLRIMAYTGRLLDESNIVDCIRRMAYASTAKVAVIPMQDILELDETGRMNTPSGSEGSWQWRIMPDAVHHDMERMLKEWATLYNRI